MTLSVPEPFIFFSVSCDSVIYIMLLSHYTLLPKSKIIKIETKINNK